MSGITVHSYAIRNVMKDDFEATIDYLVNHGFGSVEISLLFGDDLPVVQEFVDQLTGLFSGELPPCIWNLKEADRKIEYMKKKGLVMESAHLFFTDAYDTYLEDMGPELIAFAKKHGIKQYVISYMIDNLSWAKAAVESIQKVAIELKKYDIILSYHNHNMEILPLEDTCVMEYLLNHIPQLGFQADVGWIEASGGDLEYFFEKYASRIYSIHMNDMLFQGDLDHMNNNGTPAGQGDVNLLKIQKYLKKLPLLPNGLILDQDNSRTPILDELLQGKAYISEHF